MRSVSARPAQNYAAYVLLTLLFATAVTFQYRDVVERFKEFASLRDARPPIQVGPTGNEIAAVEQEAAGLREGDFLVSVNSRPFSGQSDFYAPVHKARAGDIIVLGTSSNSSGADEKRTSVTLASAGRTRTVTEWLLFVTFNVGVPLACIALGFFVAAVRPRDPQAWMVLLLLLGFVRQGINRPAPFFAYDDLFQPIGIVYAQTVNAAFPIAMALFGIYFGERLSFDRRYPWAKWLLFGPLLLAVGILGASVLLSAHNVAAAASVMALIDPLRGVMSAGFLVGALLFFVGTGYKAFRATSPDVRRRARLLLTGACISMGPFTLVVSLTEIEELHTFLLSVVLAMLFLFPATLAYVIVVQKALDVRVVIRQGVQYLLASGSVRLLQIVLSLVVIVAAALLATDEVNRPQRVLIIVLGVAGAAIIQGVATNLRRWIDRRFFREAYDADRILTDLADEVRTFVETRPLLDTVARRVSESLHVPRVALLTQTAGAFQPAYALGFREPPQLQIPEHSAIVQRLRQGRHARVYADDESSWIYHADVAEQDRSALRELDSQLLLPLSLNQKLLGIMSLGPKRSEEPFSKGDLRLLNAVATQTGLALENSRLASAIAAEVAQRERMNRELEIAREVQERLFPQECPPIEGLDYAGFCRPALGVGGDYYDFIPLSPSALGMAIGDVSGKGIPAALLMAALRASLRGQTIRRETNLAQLMATINQLLYESSTSNRYATFFYGEYDSATRELRYVNAGHNPPMIFRTGSDVIRLTNGGPAVGLIPGCTYEQTAVKLEPGDLFLGFTDGITEAMNAQEEEWGEDQLIARGRSLSGCATQAVEQVMTAADAFVAGARQYDDMTVILAFVT